MGTNDKNDRLILELIVMDEIPDVENGPYIDFFKKDFMHDFLAKKDINKILEDGDIGAFAIVKKIREVEVVERGKLNTIAEYATPYYIEGLFNDENRFMTSVHKEKELQREFRDIDEAVRVYGQSGIVVATERAYASMVKDLFEALNYSVNVFEGKTKYSKSTMKESEELCLKA